MLPMRGSIKTPTPLVSYLVVPIFFFAYLPLRLRARALVWALACYSYSIKETRLVGNHACVVCETLESREVRYKTFLFSDVTKSEHWNTDNPLVDR